VIQSFTRDASEGTSGNKVDYDETSSPKLPFLRCRMLNVSISELPTRQSHVSEPGVIGDKGKAPRDLWPRHATGTYSRRSARLRHCARDARMYIIPHAHARALNAASGEGSGGVRGEEARRILGRSTMQHTRLELPGRARSLFSSYPSTLPSPRLSRSPFMDAVIWERCIASLSRPFSLSLSVIAIERPFAMTGTATTGENLGDDAGDLGRRARGGNPRVGSIGSGARK